MRLLTLLLALVFMTAQSEPALVRLKQDSPRQHPDLKLPSGHTIGPTIPGLQQGAIPQGLTYWKEKGWFLISCYFDEKDHPSVVVALDAKGEMVRCLTLLENDGTVHAGHVGGLAVSEKYLWIGSEVLYRVPLTQIEDAEAFDYLKLNEPFHAESTASFVAYHDKRIWIGEFVARNTQYKGDPKHRLKDRNEIQKYAWIVGYKLDENENMISSDDQPPQPDAILAVRQKVQGATFLGSEIILSMSYGRKNSSTLAAYRFPLDEKSHDQIELNGKSIPVWHLDGKNKTWELDGCPPMSEGVTTLGNQFALIFESGAKKFQSGGRGPIDTVMIFNLPIEIQHDAAGSE